jgi:hypothetical protein
MYHCPKCRNEAVLQKQNVYGEGECYRLFCKSDNCGWMSELKESKEMFEELLATEGAHHG